MKNEIIKEKYEVNIHLNSLYDVLTSLRTNGSKQFYPDDINDDIDKLIFKILNYIYHDHKKYDVIDEKWYSEFTFKKNN